MSRGALKLIATTMVIGSVAAGPAAAAPPSLAVAPLPTATRTAPTPPIVTWSTGNGSPGLVTVAQPGLTEETTFAIGPSGAEAAPWIQYGQQYVFRVYSIAPQRRELVRVIVGAGTAPKTTDISLPKAPTDTPASLDRLLQAAPYLIVLLLLILSWRYARSVRG